MRETDAAGLTAWSVKRITAVQFQDDGRVSVRIASLNPAYGARDIVVDGGGEVAIDAVVREVLTLAPRQPAASTSH